MSRSSTVWATESKSYFSDQFPISPFGISLRILNALNCIGIAVGILNFGILVNRKKLGGSIKSYLLSAFTKGFIQNIRVLLNLPYSDHLRCYPLSSRARVTNLMAICSLLGLPEVQTFLHYALSPLELSHPKICHMQCHCTDDGYSSVKMGLLLNYQRRGN